jgi:hypothetical protein
MRGQRAPSGGGDRGGTGLLREGPPAPLRTPLRVVRATRDQLRVEWTARADPFCWRVVCWDGRDAAVARLELTGTHRRATFAGLARLPQPFTIAVSGLAADGSVLWQAGLSDLYLHGGSPAGRAGASGRARTGGQPATVSAGRRELVSPKRPKKDPSSAKAGKTRKPKAKKKTSRGK